MLLALLLGEMVLRLRPQLLPESAQIKRLYQLQTKVKSIGDPYLGFVYPPHYRTEISSLDFEFLIESDEHGFRNSSPWPDQADIVIVGDSMVYGWGVAKEHSWVSLLADRLPQSRIVNLGLPGAGPQQYFRYFERFGVGLRPKVLLFGIFAGNDLAGAAAFDRWVAAGSPGNFDTWRFFQGRPPKKDLLHDSLVLLLLREAIGSFRQSYASETIMTPEGRKLQLVPSVYRMTLRQNHPSNPAFRHLIQSTVAARDLARDNGIEFVAVLFPTKEEIYLPLRGVQFPSLVEPMKTPLEAEGITCIDLTDRFRERAAMGKKVFFRIDGHPNILGNRIVARAVTGHLQRNAARIGLPDSRETVAPESE
jgi:hypothetical protein